MDFNFFNESNTWKCNEIIFEKMVEINLVDIDLRSNYSKEAAFQYLNDYLSNHKNVIEDNMLASLWETYNKSWADNESVNLEFTQSAFLEKLILDSVIFEIEDEDEHSITLYYLDSGMFCGHGVEVTIEGDGDIHTAIVG